MATVDIGFNALASSVLNYGYLKPSRVGPTYSLPGQTLQTSLVELEFPILTTRKIHIKGIIGELAAFLQGAEWLHEFKKFGCNYWDHNAAQWPRNIGYPPEEHYLGRIYGVQWRDWGRHGMDQLAALVHGIKTDRYGRRHILTTWNPEELDEMCLPPCHLLAQFYARNDTLDCVVYMRSVDIALGLPSDLVLYGALLMLVAKEVNMSPGRVHMMFGDAHIYEPHIEALQGQLSRRVHFPGPTARLHPKASLFDFQPEHFILENYDPMESISYVLL
jgi:thymidylate synthase